MSKRKKTAKGSTLPLRKRWAHPLPPSAPKRPTRRRRLRYAHRLGRYWRQRLGIEGPISAGHIQRLRESLEGEVILRGPVDPEVKFCYVTSVYYAYPESDPKDFMAMLDWDRDLPELSVLRALGIALERLIVLPSELPAPGEVRVGCSAAFGHWFAAGFQGLSVSMARELLETEREPVGA